VLKALDKLPTSMPPTAHNHDDRYYTETEMNGALPSTAISLPSSANLNTYQTPGYYYTPANATAQTMTNTPWGTGTSTNAVSFSMVIVKHAGVTQIIRPYNTSGYEWQRQYYNGTWGNWVRMARTSDIPTAPVEMTGTTLGLVKLNGSYTFTGVINVPTPTLL
jgi:hypothetical protein